MQESYVAAMHWSLTQFTPATNPIAPENGWERPLKLGFPHSSGFT